MGRIRNKTVRQWMKMSMASFMMFTLIPMLQAQNTPFFDGSRAMEYLVKQCDFGPRYPGSEAHEKTARYFESTLKQWTPHVSVMRESVIHPRFKNELTLQNILARFNPEKNNRILLMAHWDTRDIAEKDPNPENRNTPILGANDGGSGVAILLTLAELMYENPIGLGVDILLLDGEDMGSHNDLKSWGLGSRAYGRKLQKPYPLMAICLDMVGDAELTLPMEQYSLIQAGGLVREIWTLAEALGYEQFKMEVGAPIYDDHRVLFEETGIPSIDIIDINYPNKFENYWHTLEDTPDKCSAESLEAVGTVVTTFLYLKELEFPYNE